MQLFRIFALFVQPLIHIFHPSSQGWKMCVFFKRVCKPLLLHEFVRNSPFTRQEDLIVDSSRSGMCFSSCLTSSIYLSITKKCIFLRYNFFLCVPGRRRLPLGHTVSIPSNPFLDPAV